LDSMLITAITSVVTQASVEAKALPRRPVVLPRDPRFRIREAGESSLHPSLRPPLEGQFSCFLSAEHPQKRS